MQAWQTTTSPQLLHIKLSFLHVAPPPLSLLLTVWVPAVRALRGLAICMYSKCIELQFITRDCSMYLREG